MWGPTGGAGLHLHQLILRKRCQLSDNRAPPGRSRSDPLRCCPRVATCSVLPSQRPPTPRAAPQSRMSWWPHQQGALMKRSWCRVSRHSAEIPKCRRGDSSQGEGLSWSQGGRVTAMIPWCPALPSSPSLALLSSELSLISSVPRPQSRRPLPRTLPRAMVLQGY